MSRFFKKRSAKAGLAPGTPVFVGDKKAEIPEISVFDYTEGAYTEIALATLDQCVILKDKPSVTWINVEGLHDLSLIDKMGTCYGLHPLVLEDILNTDQRPKIEDYEDYLYIVVKMLYKNKVSGEVESEHVSIVLGKNFVISFQEHPGDVFDPVRDRIRTGKGKLRKAGADYLAYCLIDAIVDNYFIILEEVGMKIETLEEQLVEEDLQTNILQGVYALKKDVIFLRKCVWPLREVANGMERGESKLITKHTKIYLRDVYDHTIQVIDAIENSRDLLAGLLDIYLSVTSNRLNAVMKVLTIISTIFIPLTFIAGVYGMNFKHMPELDWPMGYYVILGVMGCSAAAMVVFFKRKKWM